MKMIEKEAPTGQRVFVYYNLHLHVWSVKALDGPNKGRVIAHCKDLTLKDVTPKVSESGRQRVLREKRKNVHAGLMGEWIALEYPYVHTASITYNPYRSASFTYLHEERVFTGSKMVHMIGREVRVH